MKKAFLLLILLVYIPLNICSAQSKLDNNHLISSLKQPKEIIKISSDHYLIDFGEAYFGTLFFVSKQVQNDSLVISVGEKLSSNKIIDKNPGGTIRYQQITLNNLEKGEHTLPLKPYKRNTNPPAVLLHDSVGVIMPFRYCEIKNLTIPIEDIEFYQKAYYYPFNDDASYFTSSDTVLNQIWDLCKHTIKATTFCGYYVDGDRERIPYEADAYINQLSHYSVDNSYDVARNTNAYFIDNPTWPTEWLLHTVMLFYQDYMYTGDSSELLKYYEQLKVRSLISLAREDGLISSYSELLTPEFKSQLGFKNTKTKIKDIVDWPPAQKDTGWKLSTAEGERDGYEMVEINTVVNTFFYHNLELLAEIAEVLNKPQDKEMFASLAVKVKSSINTKLFDSSKGVYLDGEGSSHSSLHANMLPLAMGIVPDEYVPSVVEFIKSRGMACSVYGAQYLLEGLFNANEAQYALDLITDTTHDRTWWNMIEHGSTMTWEAWDKKYKPNLDWNHAWGTAPLNVISRYLWGIQPSSPGYKTVIVEPQMANLTSSTIKVPTTYGAVYGSYLVKDKNTVKFSITLPKGMEGEFVLPDNCIKIKKEKRYNFADGNIILSEGKNNISIITD